MDGYVRVSQTAGREGERFHSPEEQREAIEGWARLHGVKVGIIHVDLDRSGSTMDRPGMNEALRRVKAKQSGGVIVARIDRFARTVIGGLQTIAELDEHGARVVSVAEGVDPSTPMGEAMLHLLLLMARWQWRQADEALGAAQRRATSAGRFPGKPSFGYGRDAEGRTFVDEAQALVVLRIFTARAAGVGWRKIADELTGDGVPTPLGRARWPATTVQGIIRSEAYLGTFVGPRGLRVEDAWPAIVDRELWERANAVRGVRDNERVHNDRLLAGVARCAGCRFVLTRQVNPHGFVSYGCPTRGCRGGGSIGREALDEYVGAIVDERLARIELEPRPTDGGEELRRLTAARDAAGAELDAYMEAVSAADVGAERFGANVRKRQGDLDAAEADLAAYKARNGLRALADVPRDRRPRLADLPWEVRRAVVEELLHSVWVRRSEVTGPGARRLVDRRTLIVWGDDAQRPEFPSKHRPELGPVTW